MLVVKFNTMKKCFWIAIFSFLAINSMCQVSNLGINYQVQIRNANGVVLGDSSLSLRLTLYPNPVSTSTLWQEVHNNRRTDRMGVVNVVLGEGNKVGGSAAAFANVNFGGGQVRIKSEVSFNGGSTWVEIGQEEKMLSVPYAKYAENAVAIPAGMIMAFAGDTNKIPQGWMLCDGRELSRSDYASLFLTIGTAWGAGNGTTTFNLPDTRGYFLRGVSGNASLDPDKNARTASKIGGNFGNNIGSKQDYQIQSHSHALGTSNSGNIYDSGGSRSAVSWFGGGSNVTAIAGGNETRPVNIYVHYIIKL